MSEEINAVRDALVKAVTARKIIEQKLSSAKQDLAKWQRRSAGQGTAVDAEAGKEIASRCRQLELSIAELEAHRLAQQDLETQLKATMGRLEHRIPTAQIPVLGNLDQAGDTIQRLENSVAKKQALADLLSGEREKERKLAKMSHDAALDDELEALKKKIKEEGS